MLSTCHSSDVNKPLIRDFQCKLLKGGDINSLRDFFLQILLKLKPAGLGLMPKGPKGPRALTPNPRVLISIELKAKSL